MEIPKDLPHIYHIEGACGRICLRGPCPTTTKRSDYIMNKKVLSLTAAAVLAIGSSVSVSAGCLNGATSRDNGTNLNGSTSRDNGTSLNGSTNRNNGSSLNGSTNRNNGSSLNGSTNRDTGCRLNGSSNRDTGCNN